MAAIIGPVTGPAPVLKKIDEKIRKFRCSVKS